MHCNTTRLAWAIALGLSATVHAQQETPRRTLRVYGVGNSLTGDVWGQNVPVQLGAQQQQQVDYHRGIQVNGGAGLADQWYFYQNNVQPYYADPSSFDHAFADAQWDALVIEPFKNSAIDEITAARHIVDLSFSTPRNARDDLYVFQVPTQLDASGHTTFTGRWLEPYGGEVVGNSSTRAYFRTVFDGVKASYPDTRVALIPAGDAWAAVAAKIDAGLMPGVDESSQLYRDTLHGSYLGTLISAATWYAVTARENPTGLTLPSDLGDTTQAQADIIFSTVWDVVARQSATTLVLTPGDVNADGNVNVIDLLKLAQNYGQSGRDWYTGDFNEDGVTGFLDLYALVRHFQQADIPPLVASSSPQFAVDFARARSLVPEPFGVAAMASAIGLCTRRRRR